MLSASAPAWASGDFGCDPVWKLDHVERDDCSNAGFLSPGNDSRINLQMLMLDQRGLRGAPVGGQGADPVLFSLDDFNAAVQAMVSGKPSKSPDDQASSDSSLADGEGSRCVSNATGAAGFSAALDAAKGLPNNERAALAAARAGLAPDCTGGAAAKLANLVVKSPAGRQFAAYLLGAAAFYDGDFDAAHKQFAGLGGSNIAWLKEASRYMLGRVELNRAQVGAFEQFSATPDPQKIDTKSLAAAQTAFLTYLHDYPKGDYATSARGLLRRVDWLGGKAGPLSDEYARLLVQADWTTSNATAPLMAQEIDSKLLTADIDLKAVRSPILMATLDLMQMRGLDQPSKDTPASKKSFDLSALEAQRPVFAKDTALFDYLLAAHHFYVERDPAGALKLLPAQSDAGGYLAFSRQVLRGMALEALKDKGARNQWASLYPHARQPFQQGAVELGLALDHERAGDLDLVFAQGSMIRNTDIRSILLQHAAGPSLLRSRANAGAASDDERRLALYVLLYKELTRGRYQAFVQDIALLQSVPSAKQDPNASTQYDPSMFNWNGEGTDAEAGYRCPSVREVAKVLNQRADDARGRMCLGEFVRENGLDGSTLNAQPRANQLGSAPSQFPGAPVARLEIYKVVIADPKAPAADKTYALYRAVNCYAPSGYNHCDGQDAPPAQRKQWFKTLKSTYASSPWAEALKYYW